MDRERIDLEQARKQQFEQLRNNPKLLAALLEEVGSEQEVKVHLSDVGALNGISGVEALTFSNSRTNSNIANLMEYLNGPIISDNFKQQSDRRKWRGSLQFGGSFSNSSVNHPELNLLSPQTVGALTHEFLENNKLRRGRIALTLTCLKEVIAILKNPQISGNINQIIEAYRNYDKMDSVDKIKLVEGLTNLIIEVLRMIKSNFSQHEAI